MATTNTKTIEDIQQELGCDYQSAYGLIRFLVETGAVEIAGTLKIPGRRGRGKIQYRVVGSVVEKLADVAAKLKGGE